jgi:hypothetical protein
MTDGKHKESALVWVVGAMLVVMGLVFFVLAAIFVALSPLDWKMTLWAATFAIGIGALLICVGWWVVRPKQVGQWLAKVQTPLDEFLIDHRGLLEVAAAVGVTLTLAEATALCMGRRWPTDAFLAILLAGAIAIEWRTGRIFDARSPRVRRNDLRGMDEVACVEEAARRYVLSRNGGIQTRLDGLLQFLGLPLRLCWPLRIVAADRANRGFLAWVLALRISVTRASRRAISPAGRGGLIITSERAIFVAAR